MQTFNKKIPHPCKEKKGCDSSWQDAQTQQALQDLAIFSELAADKTLRLCNKKKKEVMLQLSLALCLGFIAA